MQICTPDSRQIVKVTKRQSAVPSGKGTGEFWQFWGWVMNRGLTSHSTLYRSFRGRFLQVRWPNQQCKSTEGQFWRTICNILYHRRSCYEHDMTRPQHQSTEGSQLVIQIQSYQDDFMMLQYKHRANVSKHSVRVPVWQKPSVLHLSAA